MNYHLRLSTVILSIHSLYGLSIYLKVVRGSGSGRVGSGEGRSAWGFGVSSGGGARHASEKNL